MSTEEKWKQVSKGLGNVSDKARKLAREICEEAWFAGHDVWFLWGDGRDPDHVYNHTKSEPVIDFMIHNEAAGDFVRNLIWERRARLGLKHVIWEQHITSTVVQPGKRRRMADRGSPTANHYDHVHSHWFGGGYVPPPVAVSSTDGSTTVEADKFLDVDGELGPKTIAKWQTIVGTTADGVISEPKSELVYWLQRYLRERVDPNLQVDGELGPKTIRALQKYLGAPTTGVMDHVTVVALQRRLNEQRF